MNHRTQCVVTFFAINLSIFGLVFAPIAFAHKINPSIIEKLTGEKIAYASSDTPLVQTGDPRIENRTFYSFPEWYIVYSAQEYGDFIQAGGQPSLFPYFKAIAQMWDSWKLSQNAAGTLPDETTYTILWTIAISFSIEYGAIGLYEMTVGHLTESLTFGYKTTEDTYIDTVAISYGQSLNQTPWYDFPYTQALSGLWSTYGWSSLTPRGIERRLVFTMGYAVKALYAKAIQYASDASFGGANLVTNVTVTDVFDTQVFTTASSTRVDEQVYAVDLPRYRAFLPEVELLSKQGINFLKIQNHTTIALSVLALENNACLYERYNVAFTMPILTQLPLERYVLIVPVQELGVTMRQIEVCTVQVEHLYDY